MVRKRVLHIWLAMMAVLFAALAPSISHALAASSSSTTPSALLQICTADGLQALPDEGPEQKPIAPVVHTFEHCPYCFTHAGSFALLPSPDMPLAIPGAHAVFPPLFYRSPRTLFVWSSGNPRGPPLNA